MALIAITMVVGLALVFHERAIEVTFGKFASIKAAEQQATGDAKEIAAIRQRVEAQAATLDLVAKESSDAKKLLEKLREATTTADAKLAQLEKKTAETAKLAEPARLEFAQAIRNTDVPGFCVTVIFKATKNEAFGRLEFEVSLDRKSPATITKLWPSLKAGAFQSGDGSFQPASDGKSAKLMYMPLGAEWAAFDVTLSESADFRITGNRLEQAETVTVH